jgi:hypothetical protein
LQHPGTHLLECKQLALRNAIVPDLNSPALQVERYAFRHFQGVIRCPTFRLDLRVGKELQNDIFRGHAGTAATFEPDVQDLWGVESTGPGDEGVGDVGGPDAMGETA